MVQKRKKNLVHFQKRCKCLFHFNYSWYFPFCEMKNLILNAMPMVIRPLHWSNLHIPYYTNMPWYINVDSENC